VIVFFYVNVIIHCGLGSMCLTSLITIFQLYRVQSVLLVEETEVPGENHRPVASHK